MNRALPPKKFNISMELYNGRYLIYLQQKIDKNKLR